MAIPYRDLLELQGDSGLIDRIATALLKVAHAKATSGNPTAIESTWIKKVLSNPTKKVKFGNVLIALVFIRCKPFIIEFIEFARFCNYINTII